MPKVKYISHTGFESEVEVELGNSVAQGALDNMVEGIDAECGGFCSCATCHCYVDDAWFDKLEGASDVEKDMLEFTYEPKPSSRLSCQIIITAGLDGLIIHLPEDQS